MAEVKAQAGQEQVSLLSALSLHKFQRVTCQVLFNLFSRKQYRVSRVSGGHQVVGSSLYVH